MPHAERPLHHKVGTINVVHRWSWPTAIRKAKVLYLSPQKKLKGPADSSLRLACSTSSLAPSKRDEAYKHAPALAHAHACTEACTVGAFVFLMQHNALPMASSVIL